MPRWYRLSRQSRTRAASRRRVSVTWTIHGSLFGDSPSGSWNCCPRRSPTSMSAIQTARCCTTPVSGSAICASRNFMRPTRTAAWFCTSIFPRKPSATVTTSGSIDARAKIGTSRVAFGWPALPTRTLRARFAYVIMAIQPGPTSAPGAIMPTETKTRHLSGDLSLSASRCGCSKCSNSS